MRYESQEADNRNQIGICGEEGVYTVTLTAENHSGSYGFHWDE